MGIFRKIFGSQRSAAAQKTLLTMKLFTSAALLMVPASNYETNDTHRRRVFVFLFGAFDAVIQHHHVTAQEKFDTLEAYLVQTFPWMLPSDIQAAVSFLCDASTDPTWIPVMERGGQTLVDWAHGDSTAPSRLCKVVQYGMDDI